MFFLNENSYIASNLAFLLPDHRLLLSIGVGIGNISKPVADLNLEKLHKGQFQYYLHVHHQFLSKGEDIVYQLNRNGKFFLKIQDRSKKDTLKFLIPYNCA